MSELPKTLELAVHGAASFITSAKTKAWLGDRIEKAVSVGNNFSLDYIVRIKVEPDGHIETRLLTLPNNEPIQLASWVGND